MKSAIACLAVVSASAIGAPVSAASLDFVKLYTTNAFHGSIAYDDATGDYYRIEGYYGGSVVKFNDAASFEANSGGTAITASTRIGTYFAASNGMLYGHSMGPASNTEASLVGEWDLADGSATATATAGSFIGNNGLGSFNWGGYSSMNVMQDKSGLYLYSGIGGGKWGVAAFNTDLSIGTTFGGLNQAGFGFAAGGKIYLGASFANPSLSYSVDGHTGAVDDFADVTFTGLQGVYISGMEYVEETDTLYLVTYQGLYKATGVAAVLDIPAVSGAVPEPATWAMLIGGLGLVGAQMRRRKTALSFA